MEAKIIDEEFEKAVLKAIEVLQEYGGSGDLRLNEFRTLATEHGEAAIRTACLRLNIRII